MTLQAVCKYYENPHMVSETMIYAIHTVQVQKHMIQHLIMAYSQLLLKTSYWPATALNK